MEASFLWPREWHVLGRDITKDEAREFTHIVRSLAAFRLLEPELDKNYAAIKATCHPYKVASPIAVVAK